MKRLFPFTVVVVLAFAGVKMTLLDPALTASDSDIHQSVKQECVGSPQGSAIAPSKSNTRNFCSRANEVAGMGYPPVVAVYCESNEFCCGRFKRGTVCTECCPI
jgi:hypothetical protein